MPIDFNTLKLNTDFILVPADTTVGSAYAQLPKESREKLAFTYVLAPLADGTYFAARWVEIEEIGRRAGIGAVRSVKLTDLAALPAPVGPAVPGGYPKLADYSFADLQRLLTPAEAAEKSQTTTQDVPDIRNANPGKRLVVLDNGLVIGLLTVELLSGDTLGNDPFKRGGGVLSINDGPKPVQPGPTTPPRTPDGPGADTADTAPAQVSWFFVGLAE